jgi:hypothetical protein
MKQIETIQIWDNGQTKEAIKLNAHAVNVNLGKSAVFYYSLLSESNETLAQGNITMDGDAYQAWDNDDIAWSFIAGKLNLVIIGDYIEPVVEEVIEEVTEPISELISEPVVPVEEPIAE